MSTLADHFSRLHPDLGNSTSANSWTSKRRVNPEPVGGGGGAKGKWKYASMHYGRQQTPWARNHLHERNTVRVAVADARAWVAGKGREQTSHSRHGHRVDVELCRLVGLHALLWRGVDGVERHLHAARQITHTRARVQTHTHTHTHIATCPTPTPDDRSHDDPKSISFSGDDPPVTRIFSGLMSR